MRGRLEAGLEATGLVTGLAGILVAGVDGTLGAVSLVEAGTLGEGPRLAAGILGEGVNGTLGAGVLEGSLRVVKGCSSLPCMRGRT